MAKSKPFLPGKKESKKLSGKEVNYRRRLILDFARDHGLVIHPGKGYDYYVEGFLQFKRCPCDPKRLSCPCDEAIEDVKREGHCLCRLFWRDLDTYKEAYVPEV